MPDQLPSLGASGRQHHVWRGGATSLRLVAALLPALCALPGLAAAQGFPTIPPPVPPVASPPAASAPEPAAPATDAAAGSATGAAATTTGGYTQRGVPAEATAENAVKAREQAYASAQRIAYERMAAEMGLPTGLPASQIDRLVSSVVVEQERSTLTGFSGRVTVNFNPGRVAALGGRGGATAQGGGAGASPAASTPPPGVPASAWVDVQAGYGSLAQYLDLRRRLMANPQVASLDLRAIATDRAVLRLGLRGPANLVVPEFARSGVTAVPAPDGTWRIGLAGGA